MFIQVLGRYLHLAPCGDSHPDRVAGAEGPGDELGHRRVAGFSQGDRIGVWSTNNIEWVLLQMATARIGAVLVNINPAYRPRELAYALQQSEVQGIFTIPCYRTSNYVDMLVELMPELKGACRELENKTFPALRRIVVYDPTDSAQTKRPYPGFTTWQEVLAVAKAAWQSSVRRHEKCEGETDGSEYEH